MLTHSQLCLDITFLDSSVFALCSCNQCQSCHCFHKFAFVCVCVWMLLNLISVAAFFWVNFLFLLKIVIFNFHFDALASLMDPIFFNLCFGLHIWMDWSFLHCPKGEVDESWWEVWCGVAFPVSQLMSSLCCYSNGQFFKIIFGPICCKRFYHESILFLMPVHHQGIWLVLTSKTIPTPLKSDV